MVQQASEVMNDRLDELVQLFDKIEPLERFDFPLWFESLRDSAKVADVDTLIELWNQYGRTEAGIEELGPELWEYVDLLIGSLEITNLRVESEMEIQAHVYRRRVYLVALVGFVLTLSFLAITVLGGGIGELGMAVSEAFSRPLTSTLEPGELAIRAAVRLSQFGMVAFWTGILVAVANVNEGRNAATRLPSVDRQEGKEGTSPPVDSRQQGQEAGSYRGRVRE